MVDLTPVQSPHDAVVETGLTPTDLTPAPAPAPPHPHLEEAKPVKGQFRVHPHPERGVPVIVPTPQDDQTPTLARAHHLPNAVASALTPAPLLVGQQTVSLGLLRRVGTARRPAALHLEGLYGPSHTTPGHRPLVGILARHLMIRNRRGHRHGEGRAIGRMVHGVRIRVLARGRRPRNGFVGIRVGVWHGFGGCQLGFKARLCIGY